MIITIIIIIIMGAAHRAASRPHRANARWRLACALWASCPAGWVLGPPMPTQYNNNDSINNIKLYNNNNMHNNIL